MTPLETLLSSIRHMSDCFFDCFLIFTFKNHKIKNLEKPSKIKASETSLTLNFQQLVGESNPMTKRPKPSKIKASSNFALIVFDCFLIVFQISIIFKVLLPYLTYSLFRCFPFDCSSNASLSRICQYVPFATL